MDKVHALAQAIRDGVADPMLLLPSLALGWWVGPWWMLLAGGLALGILRLVASLSAAEPGGDAAILWAAAFATPLLVAGITRLLRRAVSGQDPNARPRTAPRLVVAMFGATLGLVLGFGTGLALGLAFTWTLESASYDSRVFTIALVFVIPLVTIGFIAGGVIGFLQAGPRRVLRA